MGVDYHVVVEPQEYEKYARVIDSKKLLKLPFNNRGLPVTRDWIYRYATDLGAKRHWQIDDNVRHFYRVNKNKRTLMRSGVCFRIIEDFTDRYKNVAISGMQYKGFISSRDHRYPFILNHRVYSIMLFLNGLSYKWLSKNEDTDMSLQVLKDGWCTINMNAFCGDKMTTMIMSGGMTDDYLFKNGRNEMARVLQRAHPDVTKIKRRWGRWQHVVDYSQFRKNKLIRDLKIKISNEPDEYGMVLRRKEKK